MGPLLGGAGESTRVHGQHCPPLSDICGHNGHHWDENHPLCIAASYRSALYRPLCSDYVSLVLCSSPVLLSCSAPTCPLYAVLRPLCWCVPLLCPLLCSVLLCCLLRASCVQCCCVLPLRASCLARGPVAQCADQVTLPELSNHLSHSAATCRELQLNLKSSNMCKVADVQSWRKCRSSQGLK